jgi:potassium-transporting ATPase KdpC subunit
MRDLVRPAVLLLIVLTLITGIAYPLLVTGLAGIAYPWRSSGSVVARGGRVIGSRLIGQQFTEPRYFWGRPSATSPAYNGASSSGSNFGPLNPALEEAVRARVAALRAADAAAGVVNDAALPIDLVTTSASGLDPHISPAAALFQAPRVARVRGLAENQVRDLVKRRIEGRQLGILGEPRVNVLELNLALDGLPASH